MRLSELAIRNPVFAVVLAVALLVSGSLTFRTLGVSPRVSGTSSPVPLI